MSRAKRPVRVLRVGNTFHERIKVSVGDGKGAADYLTACSCHGMRPASGGASQQAQEWRNHVDACAKEVGAEVTSEGIDLDNYRRRARFASDRRKVSRFGRTDADPESKLPAHLRDTP